jgi:alpha-NAC-related protein
MRQMGLSAQELVEADKVIITSKGRKIVIDSPQVIRMIVQGQTLYQVMGGKEVASDKDAEMPEAGGVASSSLLSAQVNEDDVRFVMQQAKVPEGVARQTLISCGGDVAKTLIALSNK